MFWHQPRLSNHQPESDANSGSARVFSLSDGNNGAKIPEYQLSVVNWLLRTGQLRLSRFFTLSPKNL